MAYIDTGRVDVGDTLLPWPSNYMAGYFLLNATPQVLTPTLPSLAPHAYVSLRRAYLLRPPGPPLTVPPDAVVPWVAGGHGVRHGGWEVLLQYQLHAGCSACATPCFAQVADRFSAAGRSEGVLNLGPCERRHTGLPPGPVSEPRCPATRALAA